MRVYTAYCSAIIIAAVAIISPVQAQRLDKHGIVKAKQIVRELKRNSKKASLAKKRKILRTSARITASAKRVVANTQQTTTTRPPVRPSPAAPPVAVDDNEPRNLPDIILPDPSNPNQRLVIKITINPDGSKSIHIIPQRRVGDGWMEPPFGIGQIRATLRCDTQGNCTVSQGNDVKCTISNTGTAVTVSCSDMDPIPDGTTKFEIDSDGKICQTVVATGARTCYPPSEIRPEMRQIIDILYPGFFDITPLPPPPPPPPGGCWDPDEDVIGRGIQSRRVCHNQIPTRTTVDVIAEEDLRLEQSTQSN